MKNCSVYLKWEEVTEKVSYFVRRMAYCGYDAEFRFATVKVALSRHRRRVEKWKSGEGMFEDCKEQGVRAYEMAKKKKWYRSDKKYDTVMFVQPTKDSQLKKKIQLIARRNGVRVKVVEKAGQTLKKELQRSNPFGKVACGREDCLVCKIGKPGECRKRGVVYQLKCKADRRKYRGQTGRSVYKRLKVEMRAWSIKEQSSPLWRHSELFHGGQEFEVDIQIVNECFGKPSRRLITEAVMIDQLNGNETMNSKREWSYTKLDKVQVT